MKWLKNYCKASRDLDIYQDGLDAYDERVSMISKQGLLPELETFSKTEKIGLYIEVWSEDEELDGAEENGTVENQVYSQ